MAVPVTTTQLEGLLPTDRDDMCERLRKAMEFNAALSSLYAWMYNEDLTPGTEFSVSLCSSCVTDTTTTTTTSGSTSTSSTTSGESTPSTTTDTTTTSTSTSTSTTSTTTTSVWEETTAPTQAWRDIAISDDGMTAIAVSWNNNTTPGTIVSRIYVTFDGGDTWSNLTPVADQDSAFFKACAINSDGSRMYVIDSERTIWSWDGSQFNKLLIAIIPSVTPRNNGIDCSDDGAVVYISNFYGIYVSVDGGENWIESDPTSMPIIPNNICCSGDGAIAYCSDTASQLRKTTNTGASWGEVPAGIGPEDFWNVDCSQDGSKLIVSKGPAGGWEAYYSDDAGANIDSVLSVPLYINKVQISDDGSTMLFASADTVSIGQLLLSLDGGANWTQQDQLRNWIGCALSGDGCVKMAVVWNGGIYRDVCVPTTTSTTTTEP